MDNWAIIELLQIQPLSERLTGMDNDVNFFVFNTKAHVLQLPPSLYS